MDSEHDHIVIWFTFKNSYKEEAIDPKYLWENIEKQSRYYTKFIPYMLSNIANEEGYTMTTMKSISYSEMCSLTQKRLHLLHSSSIKEASMNTLLKLSHIKISKMKV